MNEVFKHVAWGARSLAARPAFSVLAVVTLGLGIGGGIALFSVVHAVLLRPLPYPEPERLVKLWETNLAQGGAREMTSTSNLQSWREDNRSFEGIAAWQRPTSLTLTGEEPAVELKASMVTGNYFEVLGVAAALGRTFGEEETAQGAGRVVAMTRLLNVDPGFRADGVVVARVSLGADYESNDRSIPYFQQISDRLRRIPGVAGAGAVTVLPMNPFGIDFDVPYHRPDEGEPARAEAPKARFRAATPGYFEAIGMNLRAGRGFSDRDRRGSPNVVIVNQALADKAFGPGRSAVGEALRFFWSNWQSYEVIGVVADARSYGLASGPSPELFVPHAQIPYTVMNVVVRTTGEQAGLPDVVKSVFLSLNPQQPVQAVVPMKDLISNSTARERFAFIWLSALAFLALALATIGTYSVVSYLTAQRSREIALRLTLGATPGQIVALSMRRGAALASVGVGLGLVGSWALGRLVASLLYQVEATDPVTFVAVSALLFAATPRRTLSASSGALAAGIRWGADSGFSCARVLQGRPVRQGSRPGGRGPEATGRDLFGFGAGRSADRSALGVVSRPRRKRPPVVREAATAAVG